MKTLTKALVGTIAAVAAAVSSAAPVVARDHRGGIDGGDVIAGALVIGGIAAIAAAAGNNNRFDDDSYGRRDNWRGRDDWRDGRHGNGYNRRGNVRGAIEQCVRRAERTASRYSFGQADVTDVRGIRETRWGYEVRGRIAVNSNGRDWRRGDRSYGRGWNGDYRGWNNSHRGYDAGSFSCRVEGGRVVGINFRGIRGL